MLKCNTVKDLLPHYIDGLTCEESNNEIHEHLEGCAGCNTVYEQMKAPIPLDMAKEKQSINFLKKVRRKVLRNTVIIVGAVIIIFAVLFVIDQGFIAFPVSSDEITYSFEIVTEQYGGDAFQRSTRDSWKLSVYLSDSGRALTFRSEDESEYITGEDDTVYFANVFILRQSLSLSSVPANIVAFSGDLSYLTDDYAFVLRCSDKDILISPSKMIK